MTDRELLELAAKAAGIDVFPHECFGTWPYRYEQSIDCNVEWNPLNDDGDALRLAVDLQLGIEFATCEDDAPIAIVGDRYSKVQECLAPDFKAKTRRAIVRAAAEIGKAMQ